MIWMLSDPGYWSVHSGVFIQLVLSNLTWTAAGLPEHSIPTYSAAIIILRAPRPGYRNISFRRIQFALYLILPRQPTLQLTWLGNY
jgi:hypothetical protein